MRRCQLRGIWVLFATALGLLSACSPPERGVSQTVPPEGGRIEAEVFLSARGPDRDDATFDMPWRNARETVVSLVSIEARSMPAAITCDGPGRLRLAGAGDPGLYLRPGATRRFALPSRFDGEAPELVLPRETGRCTLTWGEANSLALVRENLADPAAVALAARPLDCQRAGGGGDPLARAFFENRDLAQTCARPTGAYALYGDETEALQLRLERLTGSKMSRAVIEAGNPDMPLDFSRAPYFDEIVVSYLQVRADISGYLTARALAFHAARGTKVRIAVSGPVALSLDKKLFQSLAAQYPNVQLQYFVHQPEGFAPFRRIGAMFGNAHHVKIFAGLSREPGSSFALVGGRNLHDGFFYPEMDGLEKRPFLHDYDKKSLNPVDYINSYEDFEIGLFDRDIVADVIAQFGLFWNRDTEGDLLPRPSENAALANTYQQDGYVRHFVSLPWSDGVDQEALLVDLIDAARHEIVAITPFLYPTPPIAAALERAAARGVKLTFVTRFIGDEPAAGIVNALNSDFAAKLGEGFRVYAYDPEGRLTHAKLIVIDGRLAVVTSSNLNRRSFLGDTENGFVFLDRGVARALRDEIQSAIAKASPVPEDVSSPWLAGLLKSIPNLINQF